MSRKFNFHSDFFTHTEGDTEYSNKITVELYFGLPDPDDRRDYSIEYIWDEYAQCERHFCDFPPHEQALITTVARKLESEEGLYPEPDPREE